MALAGHKCASTAQQHSRWLDVLIGWLVICCRYTGVGGMIGKLFSQKEKVIESDDNKNKPWILW
jgi:hypothetical protein